ncbi:MAG: hypothetical protein K6T80_02405 [Firmicutes bacterium]|nr:hypothetical protein [Bacillota bacterium]
MVPVTHRALRAEENACSLSFKFDLLERTRLWLEAEDGGLEKSLAWALCLAAGTYFCGQFIRAVF